MPKILQEAIAEIETRELLKQISEAAELEFEKRKDDMKSEVIAKVMQDIVIPQPPTAEEVAKKVKVPKPKDGKSPTKEELISLIQPLIPKPEVRDGRVFKDAPQMSEILIELRKELPELIKAYAPQRNYSLIPRRSNSYFKLSNLTGTIDGVNKEFYLSESDCHN